MPKKTKISFDHEQFDRLFPFHIILDEEMNTIGMGRSLHKIFPKQDGRSFSGGFHIKRPTLDTPDPESLKKILNQLCIVEVLKSNGLTLRGEFEYLVEKKQFLFIGSPWFGSMEQVREQGLNLNDFAHHDPLIDLLHVLKTQEISAKELKDVLQKLNEQKKLLTTDRSELERIAVVAKSNENGLIFTHPDGKIFWMNESFIQLTGVTREEALYKTPIEICRGPLTNKDTLRQMTNAFFQGDAFQIEIVLYRKDGSHFWGSVKGQPIKDRNGRVTQYFSVIENIDAKKKQDERLRILSLVAEDNINAVIFADLEGRITWVNKSFTQITGYSLEESIGKRPGSFLQGPESDPNTVAFLKRQIANGQPYNCEIINYRKTGEKYWIRIQGQCIRDDQGKVSGFFALEEDITQNKLIEERIRQYEKRFRLALEKIGDNVWEHNFQTGVTYFSNTDRNLFGYSFSDITDNARLWWNNTHPDDRWMLEENDRKYSRGEIDHHSLEYRMIHKDGSIRWVLDRGVIVERDPEGKPLKVLGTHADITSIKEFENRIRKNEEKYRSIIANMHLGLMEVDKDEKILFANKAFCEMSGYDENEILGKVASQLFVKGDNREIMDKKNELRKEGVMDAYEIVVKNKRGELKWWLISGAPRFNEKGESEGSIGIHLDITKQKVMEYQLLQSKKTAENSSRTKEAFLANMSHEIRTPMNAIMGMANQLDKTKLDHKQQFFLDTILGASDNLLVIINDILDLSKIEAGKLTLERIGFELRTVVEQSFQILLQKSTEKGLELRISRYDENISRVLLGDPYRINQILLNLIGNSIKFTEQGSVEISCELMNQTEKTQSIRISVRDTGIGMDKQFIEHLFDKFEQEDSSITRQYGGTGLGMSICKQLVELMGGSIHVDSDKGKGTTVTCQIEFNRGTTDSIPIRDTIHMDSNLLKGKRILVVDDNEMNRIVATTILGNYHATTLEAANGHEAIELLKSENPDLLLMDVQMPILDGIEATRIIRKDISLDIPIIALTANAIKGDNDKCIEAGMNDYVSKPFKEEELVNMICHWLGKPKWEYIPSIEKPISSEKAYNLAGIRNISRGNDAFVTKLVNLFIEQSQPIVQEIREKFESGDHKTMGALAHKLKASIDNMGIQGLKETIREIERAGKSISGHEHIPAHIEHLESVMSKVFQELRTEFNLLDNS